MNSFFLELEHPYKQQNNIMSPLGLNSITNEYTNSLSNCTCCFPLELNQLCLTAHFSISWTATLILTTGKTKHFLFKNASKKGFKNASKMQLLFQNASKLIKKCNSTPKMLQKCGSISNMLQIKGKRQQLNVSSYLSENRAQFLN